MDPLFRKEDKSIIGTPKISNYLWSS